MRFQRTGDRPVTAFLAAYAARFAAVIALVGVGSIATAADALATAGGSASGFSIPITALTRTLGVIPAQTAC